MSKRIDKKKDSPSIEDIDKALQEHNLHEVWIELEEEQESNNINNNTKED